MTGKLFDICGFTISYYIVGLKCKSPWRNRLARSAVNRKVGGSSPPGDETFSFCCSD